MSDQPRTAASSVAAFGVSALMAAAALTSWYPVRRVYRAGAAHSHGSGSCTHARYRDSRRHDSRARTASGRGAPKRCPEAHKHAVAPGRQTRPGGSSAPGGSPGSPGATPSPAVPGGSTSSPPGQPGSGEAPAPPPSLPEVQISAVEYHFTLSRTTVPAGKVILQFVNDGQDEHNLNAQGATGQSAAAFAIERPKAVTRQVVELRPGSYTLFCSLADHEQKGMKATLTVE